MLKRFYVYMLRCSDDSFYVGITSNIEQRLAQHESGWDERCYTFKRRPLRCVHVSEFRTFNEAVFVEKRLKGWSRAKKIALANDDWSEVQLMAKRPSARARLSRPSRLATLAPQDDGFEAALRAAPQDDGPFEAALRAAPQDDGPFEAALRAAPQDDGFEAALRAAPQDDGPFEAALRAAPQGDGDDPTAA